MSTDTVRTKAELLALLRSDWHLSVDWTINPYWWVQSGRVGHGGPSRFVNGRIAMLIVDEFGMVPVGPSFPSQEYALPTPKAGLVDGEPRPKGEA